MKKNLLLLFTRNPELGKVKTRLAASIGDINALEIYCKLLKHTEVVVSKLEGVTKRVMYSEKIQEEDLWDASMYEKQIQIGEDLGERMHRAFQKGFEEAYEKIVIIGTDLLDLQTKDMEHAFLQLENKDIVFGPATDGGYYLLGLKRIPEGIFKNKNWGTNTVLKESLQNLHTKEYILLDYKNDIDTLEDILTIPELQHYIPK